MSNSRQNTLKKKKTIFLLQEAPLTILWEPKNLYKTLRETLSHEFFQNRIYIPVRYCYHRDWNVWDKFISSWLEHSWVLYVHISFLQTDSKMVSVWWMDSKKTTLSALHYRYTYFHFNVGIISVFCIFLYFDFLKKLTLQEKSYCKQTIKQKLYFRVFLRQLPIF